MSHSQGYSVGKRMQDSTEEPPLIVIVGETASGKSALAIELAQQFDGEIIAADSRTFYKGMDIGTAKPTWAERSSVRHHLIDITTPDRPIAVSDFKPLANQAIQDIADRGKVPFLVGGTGLYVDAVIYNFSFLGEGDTTLRRKLQGISVDELQAELKKKNIPLPNNPKNPRHLIRCLETGGDYGTRHGLRENTLVMGLKIDREHFERRVASRTDAMMKAGLALEVEAMVEYYTPDCQALQAIGYQEFLPYFSGMATSEDVRAMIIRNTIRYAKRQRTWFKRNKSIQWICKEEEAVDLITTFLNKVSIV